MTSVVFRRKLRNWRWCRTFYKYQFPFLTFHPTPTPQPQTMCQSGSGASKLGTFTNICYSTNWINTPSPFSRKITSTWIWLKWLFAGSLFIWGVRNRSRWERINFRNNALNLKTKYGAFKYCRGLALGSLNKKMISLKVTGHRHWIPFPKNKWATLRKKIDVLSFNCACCSYTGNSFKMACVCNMRRNLHTRLGKKGR